MMAALQEASMKVCIGHAGMLSAVGFACGASLLTPSGNAESVCYIVAYTWNMNNAYINIMVGCTKIQ